MIRAGVFVGVDQTGNLQKLNDAATGARRMYEWALAQGMPDKTHAKLITDEAAKVSAGQIYDAIGEIIDGAGVDQLILYFAGHGVNINFGEMWLLSDAPRNPNEAVNVRGSVELARYCGIGHVAVISDACRVAPEGIQAGNVRGQEIFPNEGGGDRAKPVDQYFACVLGHTAAELKDPAVAAANFTALYTDALLEALGGRETSVLEQLAAGGDDAWYVNPEPLQKYLAQRIPMRVAELKLEKKVNQKPDAILIRHPYWMSRIEHAPAAAPAAVANGNGDSAIRGGVPAAAPAAPPRETLRSVTRTLVASATQGPSDLNLALVRARASSAPGVEPLTQNIERIWTPFGPDHFETECGIKVRGGRLANCFASNVTFDPIGGPRDIVRITHLADSSASVVLEFENGRGTVVPVLKGFIAGLTFENEELIDVTYEPSSNNWRWDMYKDRAEEMRALRAVAASASRQGRFRLDAGNAMNIARKMQYAKGFDPTFAIYAAYAYHDLQALDRIREMSGYLAEDLGGTFFDLALLSRQLVNQKLDAQSRIVPFVPMLSQGWALLRANRVGLHPKLAALQETSCDSLWSLYSARGTELLKAALATGELR